MIKPIRTILCKCERCGHEWIPHIIPKDPDHPTIEEIPRVCPKCKSAYWMVPKK